MISRRNYLLHSVKKNAWFYNLPFGNRGSHVEPFLFWNIIDIYIRICNSKLFFKGVSDYGKSFFKPRNFDKVQTNVFKTLFLNLWVYTFCIGLKATYAHSSEANSWKLKSSTFLFKHFFIFFFKATFHFSPHLGLNVTWETISSVWVTSEAKKCVFICCDPYKDTTDKNWQFFLHKIK